MAKIDRRRELKKNARQFAGEVVEAGRRIKGKLENKKKQRQMEGELDGAFERVKRIFEDAWPERKRQKFEYVVAIIANLIMIHIANNLLSWDVPYLTSSFIFVLWAFNLSFWAQIIANLFYFLYDAKWFRNIGKLITDLLGLIAVYVLYVIFPFDFGATGIEGPMRLALFFAIVIIALAIVFRIFKLFVFLLIGDKKH
ncbi:MAG: hypothetical protein V1835_04770 [Candidatus Micrarchaeota archaeon]